jgi:hypothetical protein
MTDAAADATAPGLVAHLRAGAAVFNAGASLAAHDPWEHAWLDLDDGPDERLLHGLIQVAASTHHARERNWDGATTLAASARNYLAGLDGHRGVDLAPVEAWLAALATDPEVIERRAPPEIRVDGVALTPDGLEFPAASIAAPELAAARGDEETAALLDRAADFGRADLAAGKTASPFVTLLLDYLDPDRPAGPVLTRLQDHVDRRSHREADVAGLFDTDDDPG